MVDVNIYPVNNYRLSLGRSKPGRRIKPSSEGPLHMSFKFKLYLICGIWLRAARASALKKYRHETGVIRVILDVLSIGKDGRTRTPLLN